MKRIAVVLAMCAAAIAIPVSAQIMDHDSHNLGMNHAMLAGSDPSDGAVLSQAPRALTLNFLHAVTLQTLTITNANGVGAPVAWERPAHPVRTYVIALPLLENGAYRVSFTATRPDGSHAMPGVIAFSVR